MIRAIFIRHAESDANAGEATENVSRIGLTASGRVEALRLANSWTEPPNLVIVSPFLRTLLTAQPTIYRIPNVPVEEWPVQEFTYLEPSRWNGTSRAERIPAVEEWWARADTEYADGPGAESFSDLMRRVRGTLKRLEQLPTGSRVFVFTHGQFMQALQLAVIFPSDTDAAQMARFRDFDREHPIRNCATFSIGMDRGIPWQFTERRLEMQEADDESSSSPMSAPDASCCHDPMKRELTEIVGKRIAGVVVKESSHLSPPRQVFLIFDDGTNFEFYANSEVTWTSGVRPGGIEWVREYCASTHRIRVECVAPNASSASEDE
jgi:broad specificity phosphatase PhoE